MNHWAPLLHCWRAQPGFCIDAGSTDMGDAEYVLEGSELYAVSRGDARQQTQTTRSQEYLTTAAILQAAALADQA